MKKRYIIGMLVTLVVYITVSIATSECILSTPEKGITCVEVENMFGTRVPAGCFTGDVTKDDNEFNVAATEKYQSNTYKVGDVIVSSN